MNILAVGDIVGKPGINKLKECLPNIIKEKNIDFVIVNSENAADGMGLTEKMYKDIINLNVDCVTMGNHTWGKKDIFNFIEDEHIIRPANYSPNNPGKGYRIFEKKGKKIAVINLIGRATMGVLSDNPFLKAKEIIEKIKNVVDIIMSYYLDGEVTIIFGTHTHVQTADEKIMKNGTAYITDIGMTGPEKSVIGMDIEASIKRFETSLPEKYKVAEGNAIMNTCFFEINNNTNKVLKIERMNF